MGNASEDPLTTTSEQGYYGKPVLNPAPWHWLVAWYFFLGGIAGASYIIASIAGFFPGQAARNTRRAGHLVTMGALAPTPLLLIGDLGRPLRFHHMLRIFKPLSPMNLGSWTLTGFGGAAAMSALRTAAEAEVRFLPRFARRAITTVPRVVIEAPGSLLGVSLAGYTGSLLAFTAIPAWSSPWLGGLFMASAAATGSSAIELGLAAANAEGMELGTSHRAVLVGEAALGAAYVRSLRPAARASLLQGPPARLFWGGWAGIGIALPLALSAAGASRKHRSLDAAAAVATLVGGFCLRKGVLDAGHASAADPAAALEAGR
ncbi:MAG: NrfD/PsrC family molybdoenzyme membrane anchor subunit [Candidatus Dormibacteria bacterium]